MTEPTEPTIEELIAQSHTPGALAERLRMIAANPREFTPAQRAAFLEFTARRLDAMAVLRADTMAALTRCHEALCCGSYTCDEAESLFAVFTAFDLYGEAERFMCAHAETDDDEHDQHEPVRGAGWRYRTPEADDDALGALLLAEHPWQPLEGPPAP